jgi:5-methylcytosine-specific restriction protein A
VTAWEGSDRRTRLPADWPARRARVLARDSYRCTARWYDDTRCAEPATDVDHVHPGDNDADDNLTSLCGWHHRRKSASEGGTAAHLKRAPRHRPPEQHPGAIP